MDMLKKDAFHWNFDASLAFENLKKAITNTPVLTLPDFSKTFVLEQMLVAMELAPYWYKKVGHSPSLASH